MLFVFSDLQVTVGPTDTAARPGKKVSLSCQFSSNLLDVTVSWWRGNQILSATDVRVLILNEGSKSILTIMNLQTSDVGEYTCKASSPVGLSDVSTPGHVSLQCKLSSIRVDG